VIPATQEPRDGDFVAYIDQLQRESAARIHAQSQIGMIETAAHGMPQGAARPDAAPKSIPHPAARTGSAASRSDHGFPALDAHEAQELLARLARSRPAAHFVSGAVAAAVGTLLLLYSLIGSGGVLPLLIAIGLLWWAVPRLRRASADISAAGRQHARRIAETFGPRPPHA
jgi:Flp pilus assembly protein TadB